MAQKLILENVNANGIVRFMNDNFKKKKGLFSGQDVQGYLKRSSIPVTYNGGYEIRKVEHKYNDNLYNIYTLPKERINGKKIIFQEMKTDIVLSNKKSNCNKECMQMVKEIRALEENLKSCKKQNKELIKKQFQNR